MVSVRPEELVHPFPLFRLCMLDAERAKVLADKLKYEELYLPDELRNDESIWEIIYRNFGWDENRSFYLPYEIGNFDGVFVFQNIVKDDGCGLMLKFWGKQLWGTKFIRQSRGLIKMVMDGFGLKTLHTGTADPKMIKMARFAELEVKSIHDNGFLWDGVSHPYYYLEMNMNGVNP